MTFRWWAGRTPHSARWSASFQARRDDNELIATGAERHAREPGAFGVARLDAPPGANGAVTARVTATEPSEKRARGVLSDVQDVPTMIDLTSVEVRHCAPLARRTRLWRLVNIDRDHSVTLSVACDRWSYANFHAAAPLRRRSHCVLPGWPRTNCASPLPRSPALFGRGVEGAQESGRRTVSVHHSNPAGSTSNGSVLAPCPRCHPARRNYKCFEKRSRLRSC